MKTKTRSKGNQATQAWNSTRAEQLKKQVGELAKDSIGIAGLLVVEGSKAIRNVFAQFKQRRRR